ncbi:MAG: phosphoglycerate dehydrogenase [Anaerolineae bacterium]|nr:phosphoglycerate dehydrogenase [Anaerolineae bacterium]
MTKKVLVTEALAEAGLDLLRQTCQVTVHLKPSHDELLQMIGDYDALIVRSATDVNAQVLAAGTRLAVVGRAGTGVDNIDVQAATHRGILVVNAPTSNTVAVAEHTMALMLSLARHIPQANSITHAGLWEKKGLMGTELRDKTLGLVGFGRVGRAVASRASGFDMHIVAYDPFVSPEIAARYDARLLTLDELLSRSDYVSLHAPSTERTRGIISARELALMRPTAYLINCARGDLVIHEDLVQALCEGHIAGAALDVFIDEPNIDPSLCENARVLLTPHLGASTEEAQSSAALQVARQVIDVLAGRPPRYPVNITAMSSEAMKRIQPYLDLATRMGHFYAQFAENNLTELEITYAGSLSEENTELITAALLQGVLAEAGQELVNLVNARLIAEEHGLVVREVRTTHVEGYSSLLSLSTKTTRHSHLLSGTLIHGEPHIVQVDNYWLDFVPRGHLLVDEHLDQPGLVGLIGTILGDADVNISFVQLGRAVKGGQAVMVLGVDEPLVDGVLDRIRGIETIRSAHFISL